LRQSLPHQLCNSGDPTKNGLEYSITVPARRARADIASGATGRRSNAKAIFSQHFLYCETFIPHQPPRLKANPSRQLAQCLMPSSPTKPRIIPCDERLTILHRHNGSDNDLNSDQGP
jgi:hypothetical protein